MNEYGTQGRNKKQLQKSRHAQSIFYNGTEGKKGQSVKKKVPNATMAKYVGYQLPNSKMFTVWIEKVEGFHIKSCLGQGHLSKAHQNHDDQ